MSKTINGKAYTTFDDLWNEPGFLSDTEKAEIELHAKLVGKLIEAREREGLSQKKLAELSGMKQSAIARLESMQATPQINTMLKLLIPLGYELDIVKREDAL